MEHDCRVERHQHAATVVPQKRHSRRIDAEAKGAWNKVMAYNT